MKIRKLWQRFQEERRRGRVVAPVISEREGRETPADRWLRETSEEAIASNKKKLAREGSKKSQDVDVGELIEECQVSRADRQKVLYFGNLGLVEADVLRVAFASGERDKIDAAITWIEKRRK